MFSKNGTLSVALALMIIGCGSDETGESPGEVLPPECTAGQVETCGPESDVGVCEFGTRSCIEGQWSACEGAVHPSAETCDQLDNDCNGAVDDDPSDVVEFYLDQDGDGFGTAESAIQACSAPEGYVALKGDCLDTSDRYHPLAEETDCTDPEDYNCDGSVGYADADDDGFAACEECNDSSAEIRPGADEYCDLVDNNCDGTIDEDSAVDAQTFYLDGDSDGYGDPTVTAKACNAPTSYVTDSTDCNDATSNQSPGATEVCDEVDNNCDGQVDVDAADALTFYRDSDSDGFGDAATKSCSAPDGYVAADGDCNDDNARINPNAAEVCDSIDNDCDGTADQGAVDAPTWYRDADGDGHGTSSPVQVGCSMPAGYAATSDDCDDDNENISPSQVEDCNFADDNCNGITDENMAFDSKGAWVNGTLYSSISNAVSAASAAATGDDTVLICPGSYEVSLDLGHASIVLESVSGDPSDTILSGGGTQRIINHQSGDLTIRGLTLTDGYDDYDGGAIATGGSLIVENSAFENNRADYEGGAISAGSSSEFSVDVTNTVLQNNSAGYAGGAIQFGGWGNGTLSLHGCQLIGNDAEYEGGGASVGSWGDYIVVVTDTELRDNTGSYSGGAFELGGWGAIDATITGSSLVGNTSGRGAGINVGNDTDATLYFEATDMLSNVSTASSSGSALHISTRPNTVDLSISGGTTAGNTAGDSGAAVVTPNAAKVVLSETNWTLDGEGNSPADIKYGCGTLSGLGDGVSLSCN
jgi:hypothetical protein